MPSMNTPGSNNSTSTVDKTAGSADKSAWLELQKEMGSLKVDNRMFVRGSARINVHSKHNACGSAVSVLTKSLAENSTACAEATTDLIAKKLSLGLDGPAPAWKRDGPGKRPREKLAS